MTDTSSKPTRFRKKPVEVEATQWHRNGDHPHDNVGKFTDGALVRGEVVRRIEGAVVRFYRHPDVDGSLAHCDVEGTARPQCVFTMHEHGWIDTMEGGHTVCPGDWIITGVRGEVYPCEQHIFEETYEPVEATS